MDFDIFNEEIQRPKKTSGYNFGGQDGHHLATQILDRTVSGTDGFWITPQKAESEVFAGDDVCVISTDATGKIQVTFNAVTLVSTQTVVVGTAYFVKFAQAASSGEIWVGTKTDIMLSKAEGAVGAPTAASTAMVYGNDNTTGPGANTYMTQMMYDPIAQSIIDVENDRLATKAKA